jgi:hypothetical protein
LFTNGRIKKNFIGLLNCIFEAAQVADNSRNSNRFLHGKNNCHCQPKRWRG